VRERRRGREEGEREREREGEWRENRQEFMLSNYFIRYRPLFPSSEQSASPFRFHLGK
jgi:hypothetical protein